MIIRGTSGFSLLRVVDYIFVMLVIFSGNTLIATLSLFVNLTINFVKICFVLLWIFTMVYGSLRACFCIFIFWKILLFVLRLAPQGLHLASQRSNRSLLNRAFFKQCNCINSLSLHVQKGPRNQIFYNYIRPCQFHFTCPLILIFKD